MRTLLGCVLTTPTPKYSLRPAVKRKGAFEVPKLELDGRGEPEEAAS
ncbi:hypothetical protein ACTNDP_15050 [Paenibacillus barengoltzii]